jgi:hypothetical protein
MDPRALFAATVLSLFPAAKLEKFHMGRDRRTYVVTVPGLPLPVGWSKDASAISFDAAFGEQSYPAFLADPDLRLSSGALPRDCRRLATFGGDPMSLILFAPRAIAHNPFLEGLEAIQTRFLEAR